MNDAPLLSSLFDLLFELRRKIPETVTDLHDFGYSFALRGLSEFKKLVGYAGGRGLMITNGSQLATFPSGFSSVSHFLLESAPLYCQDTGLD